MKYEYRVLEYENSVGQETNLNEMGELGWELVAVGSNPETKAMVLYLKRPTLKK